ncbi:MAG: hypothetical protein OEN20_12080 [Gammaproteobacteria bacterium]|nr:hypothetical protein [Gammaproteobacteria bacterium]
MARTVAAVLVTTILITVPAAGDVFLGVNAGRMDVGRSGAGATNLGLTLSSDLDVLHLDLGVAAELTRTAISGETRGGDIDVDTNALYVTVKTPGTVFVRLRGGFMNETVRVGRSSDSDSEFSWGAGLGANIGKVRVALGYTTGWGAVDYLSFGVQFLIAGARE